MSSKGGKRANWTAGLSMVLSVVALAVSIFFALPQAARDYGWTKPPWTKRYQQELKEQFVRSNMRTGKVQAGRAETYVAAGSPASRYAKTRSALVEAYEPLMTEAQRAKSLGMKTSATSRDGGAVEGCRAGDCAVFDDFEFTSSNKIWSFTINRKPSTDFIVVSNSGYDQKGVTARLVGGVRNRDDTVLNVALLVENYNERAILIDGVQLLDQVTGDTERILPESQLFKKRVRPFQTVSGYFNFRTSSNRGWIGIEFHLRGKPRTQVAWVKYDPS